MRKEFGGKEEGVVKMLGARNVERVGREEEGKS